MFQELILVKCCWRLRWWSLEIGRKSITRFSTLPWIASAVLGLTNEVNLLDARTWSLSVYFQTSGNTLGTSKEPSYKLFCFIWRFVWSLERILLAILEASLKYLESLNSNYLRHLSPWMAGSHLPGLPSWPWCNFRVGAQVVQPRPRMLRYEILVESLIDSEIFDFGRWVVSNVFF